MCVQAFADVCQGHGRPDGRFQLDLFPVMEKSETEPDGAGD